MYGARKMFDVRTYKLHAVRGGADQKNLEGYSNSIFDQ